MRSSSRRPWPSNRQSSTFSALAEKSAKLVPRPSQLAPRRAAVRAVHLMQRRQRAIQPVEIADQGVDAGIFLLLEQMPVQRTIVIPLALLAELAAHEHQLLAGMAEHEAVIGPQIGEALPLVAGHAAEDRAFAVHHLVMRQRQDEILPACVMQSDQEDRL